MDDVQPRYKLSMRATLLEFAGYDAGLLFCAFLRNALLFVYADSGVLVYRPHQQRSLALRLHAECTAIAHRFMWLCQDDFRGAITSARALEDYSSNVRHMGSRARAGSRAETLALTRLMRREDATFEFRTSAFDPARYARNMEKALQDSMELSPVEMNIVFMSWADVFSKVMRGTYLKYHNVLEGWPRMLVETRQDFVDG